MNWKPYQSTEDLPIGLNMPKLVVDIPNGFKLKSINEKIDDSCTVTLTQNGVESDWHVDYTHGTSALKVIYPAPKEGVRKMVDRRLAAIEARAIQRRVICSSLDSRKTQSVETDFTWKCSAYIIVSMLVIVAAGILIGAAL